MKTAVEFSGVGRIFPGVKALDEISLRVENGTVHGLFGYGGAGKSTLLRTLCGFDPDYTGMIRLYGKPVRFQTPAAAMRQGILIRGCEFPPVPPHVPELSPPYRNVPGTSPALPATFPSLRNVPPTFPALHHVPEPLPYMTVAEWMTTGCEPVFCGLIRRRKLYRETDALLGELGAAFHAADPVRNLSPGQQGVLSVAAMLYRQSVRHERVAVLDEPAAACNTAERQSIFHAVRKLREQGVTIIYATRFPDEITELCDRVSILRDGVCVRTADIGKPGAAAFLNPSTTTEQQLSGSTVQQISGATVQEMDITSDEETEKTISRIIADMTDVTADTVSGAGTDVPAALPPHKSHARNAVMLKAEHLNGAWFHDAGFVLHEREILGFYGLSGAGHIPFIYALAGLIPFSAGIFSVKGRSPVKRWSVSRAHAAGITLITPSGERSGCCGNLTGAENLILSQPRKARSGLFLNREKMFSAAQDVLRQIQPRTDPGTNYISGVQGSSAPQTRTTSAVQGSSSSGVQNSSSLSGVQNSDPQTDMFPEGFSPDMLNRAASGMPGAEQWKTALARCLSSDAEILMFDRPAKGLHAPRRQELYRLMEQLPRRGYSLIVASDDWEEITQLCDRAVVMRGGTVAAIHERREFATASILKSARGNG